MAGGPDPGSTNTSLSRHGTVPTPDSTDAGKVLRVSTDGSGYELGSSRLGTAATASTPGTVVKKLEVFDASGASLGFVAIYDAIT